VRKSKVIPDCEVAITGGTAFGGPEPTLPESLMNPLRHHGAPMSILALTKSQVIPLASQDELV